MVPHDGERTSAVGDTLGEDARTQGTERYASLFTHHPHAAYSVDERGCFTDANDRSLEMVGLTLEEMRGVRSDMAAGGAGGGTPPGPTS